MAWVVLDLPKTLNLSIQNILTWRTFPKDIKIILLFMTAIFLLKNIDIREVLFCQKQFIIQHVSLEIFANTRASYGSVLSHPSETLNHNELPS